MSVPRTICHVHCDVIATSQWTCVRWLVGHDSVQCIKEVSIQVTNYHVSFTTDLIDYHTLVACGADSVVKVVFKRRRGPPYPQSWVTPILGTPLRPPPFWYILSMKNRPLLPVVSIDRLTLGITTALVVIKMTLRHTSRERLAQELSTGSLHAVHSSRVNSSSTVTAKIYWYWLKCTTAGFHRTHTGPTY